MAGFDEVAELFDGGFDAALGGEGLLFGRAELRRARGGDGGLGGGAVGERIIEIEWGSAAEAGPARDSRIAAEKNSNLHFAPITPPTGLLAAGTNSGVGNRIIA